MFLQTTAERFAFPLHPAISGVRKVNSNAPGQNTIRRPANMEFPRHLETPPPKKKKKKKKKDSAIPKPPSICIPHLNRPKRVKTNPSLTCSLKFGRGRRGPSGGVHGALRREGHVREGRDVRRTRGVPRSRFSIGEGLGNLVGEGFLGFLEFSGKQLTISCSAFFPGGIPNEKQGALVFRKLILWEQNHKAFLSGIWSQPRDFGWVLSHGHAWFEAGQTYGIEVVS